MSAIVVFAVVFKTPPNAQDTPETACTFPSTNVTLSTHALNKILFHCITTSLGHTGTSGHLNIGPIISSFILSDLIMVRMSLVPDSFTYTTS